MGKPGGMGGIPGICGGIPGIPGGIPGGMDAGGNDCGGAAELP